MIASASPNNDPYNVVTQVTPEIAFRWLEGNTHNRPINQAHVQRLAQEMRAGRWRLTHQGIAFDINGLLIDGQHRLCAVIDADLPITMRVFYNEPPENRHVLDTGDRRTNLDVFLITGEVGDVNTMILATLRAMLTGMQSSCGRMTPGAEAEFLGRHRLAIDFAIEHFGTAPTRGLAAAHIRAVIARAYYSADHTHLARFCDVLRSGVSTSEADHIVIALRDFLIESYRAARNEAARRLRYAKTEWALAAFLNGRQPKRLCGSDAELFDLPEEQNRSDAA